MEIKNDSKDYIGAELQTQGSAIRNVVRSTDIVGGVFRSQGVMNIGNKLVRIDNKEPKLVINNGTQDNILIGKRTDGTYGFDIAKAGYDVNGASNSNLFYSDRFIKVSYKFSKPGGNLQGGSDSVGADGIVQYWISTGANDGMTYNLVQLISFYKEANLVIESCVIETKWYDGIITNFDIPSFIATRPGACTLYLNPSVANVTDTYTLTQRYGSTTGTVSLATITPDANGYTNTETLTPTEITGIVNGWNTIVLQVNDSSSGNVDKWGAVALDVSIKGYLT